MCCTVHMWVLVHTINFSVSKTADNPIIVFIGQYISRYKIQRYDKWYTKGLGVTKLLII